MRKTPTVVGLALSAALASALVAVGASDDIHYYDLAAASQQVSLSDAGNRVLATNAVNAAPDIHYYD